MNNLKEYLRKLWSQGVEIYLEEGQLRYSATKLTAPETFEDKLQAQSSEIIEILQKSPDAYTGFPLSHGQYAMVLMQEIAPTSIAYNATAAFQLKADLDIDILRASMDYMIQRHEALRTEFCRVDGELAQRVLSAHPQPFNVVEVEGFDDESVEKWIDEQADEPFDLSSGPNFFTTLLDNRNPQGEHNRFIFLALGHHAAIDFIAVENMASELALVYASLEQGAEPDLPATEVTYKEYVIAELQDLEGERGELLWDYWQPRVSSISSTLELPTDYPRPPLQSFKGAEFKFDIDALLHAAIKKLALQLRVTPFVVVMAAYQILIQRYTKENKIAFGIPMANRSQHRSQKVVGHFTNPTALVADLSDNPSFAELVKADLEHLKGAMAHQDLPLPYIVNRLELERDLSRPPLIQTGFSWNQTNHKRHNIGTGSILEDIRRSEQRGAIYDLVMSGYDNGKTVACSLRYNVDIFKHETVGQISKHFLQLLRGIIAAPQEPVNSLVMVTNKELGQLLDVDISQLAAIAPLTAIQQDLYLAQVLDPDTETNCVGITAELHTDVDASIMQDELQRLVDGNVLLRASLIPCNKRYCDSAYWVIDKHKPVNFIVTDLSDQMLSDEAMRLYINKRVYRPYDISGELYQFELIKRAAADYVLLVFANHLIFDGLALTTCAEQVLANYECRVKGEPINEPQDTFLEYINKARDQFDSDKNRRFWQNKFASVEPLDIPAPVKKAGKQVSKHITLDAAQLQQIETFSNEHRLGGVVRYFKVLYCLLINAYSNQSDDFQIRDTWSRRTKRDQLSIGCYHQMVPFIVPQDLMTGDTAIDAVFDYARQHTREIIKHSQVSLLLQNQLAAPGQLGFMYNYYITPSDVAFIDGKAELTILAPLEVDGQVQLIIKQEGDQLVLNLHYDGDRFPDLQFLQRLMALSEQLLSGAQCLGDLNILIGDERRQLLSTGSGAWNATELNREPVAALHHLIEEQVTRTPDSPAVSFDAQVLSFHELNERANQLAHYLRSEFAVGPDVLVGLCMERSLELSVALLAVLKAGGAYVPFDPSFPQDRLGFMLEDTSVSVMLTQSHLTSSLPTDKPVTCVCLDTDAQLWSEQSSANVDVALDPDQLLNVIFTSGSTGKPKGVMVPHRGIINRLQWMQKAYPLDASDRVLQKTPYSFDVSVWELFWPLMVGAELVYAKPDGHKDPDYLRDLICERDITTLHFVPSMLGVFLQAQDIEQCTSIRRVFCSGEALQLEHERRFFERLGHGELHNLYGPTEASVDVSYFACKPDSDYRSVPIGKPVDNTQLHILDSNLQPVPVGIVGELYIGGVQLARGYLNREELTNNTFIDNPFYAQGHPSKRLYKTGDLARYLPDGNIEYIGRVDFQVKVRGLRIELGEIENVLHQHEQVKETIVITKDLGSDNVVIVAYLVPEKTDQVPTDDSLRRHLLVSLPEYMVPNFFVSLDAIPLMPNGKANRKALPDPALGAGGADYVAPRTELEQQIVAIWQEILQVAKVGIYDNFFESGGHSLLATQTVSRLQEVLQIKVGIRTLFDYPTVASLAEFLDDGDHAQGLTPISVMDRPQTLPLSLAQHRLWFVEQLNPGNVAYLIPGALRIFGPLDVNALNRAVETIIHRHESLRTRFVDVDGEAVQLIDEPEAWELPITDLSDLPRDEQELQVRAMGDKIVSTAYDFGKGHLYHFELITLRDDEHVLLISMHHIISDGWSAELLLSELGMVLQAYEKGEENPLAPLDIQYADYTLWQREWLHGAVMEQQLDYWRRQLANAPSLIPLPTDHPRPAIQSSNGAIYKFVIPQAIADGLRELGLKREATLFQTLMAAYTILISRYTQQSDICIGFPISGRTAPELEAIMGLFVNNLVIRSDLEENPSVLELIEQVKQTTLDAYDHQDVPFDLIVDALKVPRSLSHTPLLQVSFVLQPFSVNDRTEQLLGRRAEVVDIDWITAKYDLNLNCFEDGGRISAEMEYNTDLFEATTIERMMIHFRSLLCAMLVDPEQSVKEIPLITAQESNALLALGNNAWNATEVAYEPVHALHYLFEGQVLRSPDAIAVSAQGQSWTYQQLNDKANQLAHYLRTQGVGPDVLVGVAMERSLEMSQALMAVLKAGGAYVPFDPSFPSDRLAYMFEDSAAVVLLTQSHLKDQLPESQTTLLCLDSDTSVWENQSTANLDVELNAQHLFNVIYTSGSTGKPKGVMVPHEGIINRLLWMQDAYPLESNDIVLQKTPYSFDVSVWELFWPLITGARIVYAKAEGHKDPDYLRDMIREHAVTTLHFVPSMLGVFLQTPDIEPCDSIKRVFCSGEALQLEHERRFFERLPNAELHNLYGPTEASVDVSYFACSPVSAYRSVPIGKPVANTQLHILDEYLRPVPMGVVGELYIGGVQLARGYLNREELTQSTFIDNPFYEQGHPSRRLYKSGDLARYLPDGNIEYIGRVDFQVKVRGLRIELGEIETVLYQHEKIKDAIVLTHELGVGNVNIVAYLVAEDPQDEPEPQALRTFLKAQLPEYMVPNIFMFLEDIPLSANGKVNRKALPVPELDQQVTAEYVAPRNETEETIAAIWAEVLELEKVGIHDNFFELGGQSLMATQVMSRIRERMDTEIALRVIFESPTVAELAVNLLEAELDDIDLDDIDLEDDDMAELLAGLLDDEDDE